MKWNDRGRKIEGCKNKQWLEQSAKFNKAECSNTRTLVVKNLQDIVKQNTIFFWKYLHPCLWNASCLLHFGSNLESGSSGLFSQKVETFPCRSQFFAFSIAGHLELLTDPALITPSIRSDKESLWTIVMCVYLSMRLLVTSMNLTLKWHVLYS